MKDKGLDCSGFIGYVFRQTGNLPIGYDNTAQGYYNRYAEEAVLTPSAGCLSFYGKTTSKVTHVMLCLTNVACIGAVRGNRHMDTPERAKQHGAEITIRRIDYRKVLAIVDPFKGGSDA